MNESNCTLSFRWGPDDNLYNERETRVFGLSCREKTHHPRFICFKTIPARDGRMDRQMNT